MIRRTHKFATGVAGLCCCAAVAAGPLRLPDGMAGVADIGAIPCEIFSEMARVAPKGSRLSLLTWADGYFFARTGRTLEEILASPANASKDHDFIGLTDVLVDYCAGHPEAMTREAVIRLGEDLIPVTP